MIRSTRLALIGTALLLGACESSFNADLGADTIDLVDRVQLGMDGVELRRADGTSLTLTRADTGFPELLSFQNDTLFSLISNSEIDEGSYTGARLILADDDEATTGDDNFVLRNASTLRVPIDLPINPPYADATFSLDEDDNASLILIIDLRLSLSLNAAQTRYQLDPVLRAVEDGEGAEISGLVANNLISRTDCLSGVAVYAFKGENIEADERDGAGVEPVASSPVQRAGANNAASYRLRFMPAGSYTLALTCDGERENGLRVADPEMLFDRSINVDVDEGEIEADADFTS